LFVGDYQGLTAAPTGFDAIYITAAGDAHTKHTAVVSQTIG
jgi:hypothetical protein